MNKLDSTDLKILALLQQNARLTIKEMAAQLNRSTTPVFERIKRLEREGVIERYVAMLSRDKLGKKLTVFVDISMKDHSKGAIEEFVDQITAHPEVVECHHVTGESDFLLKVLVQDVETYNRFVLDKLSTVDNIGKVGTRFSLSVRKQTHAVDLADVVVHR